MLNAGWPIELVVRADEPEPCHEFSRGRVLWVVTGKECRKAEDGEAVPDDAGRRFERVALPPMFGGDVDAEFRRLRVTLSWPKAAAADMLAARKEKEGPVLKPVQLLRRQLSLKPRANLGFREAARRNEPRDGWIPPQLECEGDV